MDKIFVKNLSLNCIIGILDEERLKPQPLIVSLELHLDLKKAGTSGDLSKTIDYAYLSERVKKYIIRREARLLEELGYELCEMIITEFKPSFVRVKLEKPQALSDAQSCGVEICKGVEN